MRQTTLTASERDLRSAYHWMYNWIYPIDDIFDGPYTQVMTWTVVLSDEVAQWYASLSPTGTKVTDRILARLESEGHLLRMPHSKPLAEGIYELRFTCERTARRITYVLDSERQAITLTTFRKQRNNERREVLRARRMKRNHDEERQER